jgi:hypothetical protein
MGSPTGLPIASLSSDHPEEAGRPCPKAKEKAEIKESRLPFFLHPESFSNFLLYNRFDFSCQPFFLKFGKKPGIAGTKSRNPLTPSLSPSGERGRSLRLATEVRGDGTNFMLPCLKNHFIQPTVGFSASTYGVKVINTSIPLEGGGRGWG